MSRSRRAERGQASVLLVGMVLMGLAFTGLAVDGTRLFTARRDLSALADAAALAAASEIDVEAYRASGGREVRLDPAAARTVVADILADSGLPTGTRVRVDVTADRVDVGLERPVGLTFLAVVGLGSQTIGASAHASPNVG